jgi:hypothetical protein
MTTTTIVSNISGRVEYTFESADDLMRLLTVLERGLENNTVFNEDIQELADSVREVLNRGD